MQRKIEIDENHKISKQFLHAKEIQIDEKFKKAEQQPLVAAPPCAMAEWSRPFPTRYLTNRVISLFTA